MFINYLTLSLVTAAATLTLGAWFLLGMPRGHTEPRAHGFAWAFGAAGLVMGTTGLHMITTWPIPGGYNILFGEPLTYFGVLLVVGAPALGTGQKQTPLLVLGAFGGMINVVLAVAILRFGLTRFPWVGATMYFMSGIGLLILPAMYSSAVARKVAGGLFAATTVLFVIVGTMAYLEHPGPAAFGRWVPIEMRVVK